MYTSYYLLLLLLLLLLSRFSRVRLCATSQTAGHQAPRSLGSSRQEYWSGLPSIQVLSFIVPIFAWNVPLVSLIFLNRFLVFPFLLFSSISLHWSLRKAFISLLAWHSAFTWVYLSFSPLLFTSLHFTAICRASSDSHFAFLQFFSVGWSCSLSPVQCHEPSSIVHQALCLSDLVP